MHPRKMKLIMTILTPPVWVGCMILLAGTYSVAWVLIAYDKFRAMSVDDRVVFVELVCILICTLLAVGVHGIPPSESPITHETCFDGLTDQQCQLASFWFYMRLVIAVVAASMAISAYCLWKMGYILWRYYRWSQYARNMAMPKVETGSPQTDLSRATH
jgi:hypothetical protein